MNSQYEQFDTQRLNAISITEVARRLGAQVRKVGVHSVALCPWHDDHRPSLSLVETSGKNYCHCFSCGKGGDVISYAMQSEGWSF
jgi:DNA primase